MRPLPPSGDVADYGLVMVCAGVTTAVPDSVALSPFLMRFAQPEPVTPEIVREALFSARAAVEFVYVPLTVPVALAEQFPKRLEPERVVSTPVIVPLVTPEAALKETALICHVVPGVCVTVQVLPSGPWQRFAELPKLPELMVPIPVPESPPPLCRLPFAVPTEHRMELFVVVSVNVAVVPGDSDAVNVPPGETVQVVAAPAWVRPPPTAPAAIAPAVSRRARFLCIDFLPRGST